ncbi:MAG: lipopolysaccharide heptosyltransferase II [Pyrinomonadaceae bacterium]
MKILVRGTNWIGDAVMTIPALRELRRIFPDAEISLHTRSWARGIFQDAEFINEILTFETESSKIKIVLEQSNILKEKNFDLAVLFPNSLESALIARLAKIPKRFGYAKDGRSFLLSDAVEIPEWKNERHEVFYYLNLAAQIEKSYFGTQTVLENEPRVDLNVSEERRIEARKILEENGVDLSKKTVALGVGSTNSRAKRWQAESYAKLNNKLQVELSANVILVGTKDELDVSNEVFEKSEKKPLILTGKTNLAQAGAILSEIDLLVSNDMGLAHIAPAVGTQTIVIFGPTNEKTTQPIGSEIIRKSVECSPCMLRDCPIDHRCMTRISADEVFEKAISILNQ